MIYGEHFTLFELFLLPLFAGVKLHLPPPLPAPPIL